MDDDARLSALFDELSEEGIRRPTAAEVDAALDLARVVAHGAVRRAAPLVCYATGLALTAATDPEERAARLRALAARVEAAFPADG